MALYKFCVECTAAYELCLFRARQTFLQECSMLHKWAEAMALKNGGNLATRVRLGGVGQLPRKPSTSARLPQINRSEVACHTSSEAHLLGPCSIRSTPAQSGPKQHSTLSSFAPALRLRVKYTKGTVPRRGPVCSSDTPTYAKGKLRRGRERFTLKLKGRTKNAESECCDFHQISNIFVCLMDSPRSCSVRQHGG